jgi:enoyl-CoA hydratase/carnithine racemase
MEKTGHVSLQIEQNMGIISIDNPPGNYLVQPEFIRVDFLRDWIEKNELKGILICGTGKHFSGGADLDALFTMSRSTSMMKAEINKGKDLLRFIENLNIPVIAAIRGICFGGGLEIILACHMRICSDNALFAFPETNHGMMPGLGGINKVMELTSFHESMTFVLSGDMINAEEAKAMKLVDHITSNEELINYSKTLLNKMIDGKRLKVIHYVMKALHNSRTMTLEDAIKEETRMFCELAAEEMERRMRNEE